MDKPLLLDQTALATFVECRRRFQLRYLSHLSWPSFPLEPGQELAVERGRQLHRLIEQHVLGLSVEGNVIQANSINDPVVRDLWRRFEVSDLDFPPGARWPEHRLTIPVGGHFLTGRFDLVIIGESDGRPYAQIYDWKTGRPRSVAELKTDWQTRLYLALIAESGQALAGSPTPLLPEQISMTYWYASEPDQPRFLAYDDQWHQQNWTAIQQLVSQIDALDPNAIWPLTDNWELCRTCLYQVYCGRQQAGQEPHIMADEDTPYEIESGDLFEPQTP